MKYNGKFITEDLPGGEDVWVIHDTFSFLDSLGVLHIVPCGLITDGASIPRILWPLLGHPRDTDIGAAAAVHDMLYRTGQIPRRRADEVLREGMATLGCNVVKRNAVYAGVRLGGWVAWNNYRKRQEVDP